MGYTDSGIKSIRSHKFNKNSLETLMTFGGNNSSVLVSFNSGSIKTIVFINIAEMDHKLTGDYLCTRPKHVEWTFISLFEQSSLRIDPLLFEMHPRIFWQPKAVDGQVH